MNEDSSFFSNTKYEKVMIGETEFTFPIKYIKQSRISATFTASSERVREMLPSEKLTPVEIHKGITTLTFIAMNYQKADPLPPYNEFGTFTPVTYRQNEKDTSKQGIYIFHLPVTTERARYSGVELYGYPKIIADIDINDHGDSVSCELWADGKDIITLDVDKVKSVEVTNRDYTFTKKGKQLLYTLLENQGRRGIGSNPEGASYKLGSHKISQELRKMEIGKTPLEYSYTPEYQTLLYKPSEYLEI